MLEAPIPFDKFLILPNMLYISVGLETYGKNYKMQNKFLTFAVFLVSILNLKLIFLLEILFVINAFKANVHIEEALLNLAFIGFVAVGVLKMVSVWRKRAELVALIRDLEDLYPKTVTEQAYYNVKEMLQHYNRISVPFVTLSYLLMWSYNLIPLLAYYIFDYWLQLIDIGRTFPYHIYLPWNYSAHWSYFVFYVLETMAGHTTMAGQMGTDALIFAVATQVIMHYKYLAKHIEQYEAGTVDPNEEHTINETYKRDLEFLRSAFEYHKKILNFSATMNDIFGVSLFFNFMSACLVLCFLGFQTTINIRKDIFVIVVLFLCCNLMQVYSLSYYGNELLSLSENIGDAVYNHNWSNADLPYKKMIVLFIQRAQKSATLQATPFLRVSLVTMADLVQASFKFFTLLRTLYAE